ncbi:MAG: sugar transferase [Lutibacter sp.]|nr:sugar transferase [Lutibacter sp.]
MYNPYIKRILDFSIALLGLLILNPLLLLVIVGLTFANNGKPFFFSYARVRMARCSKLKFYWE